eukprot:9634809-Alexandrium_andersonii.AAC.1
MATALSSAPETAKTAGVEHCSALAEANVGLAVGCSRPHWEGLCRRLCPPGSPPAKPVRTLPPEAPVGGGPRVELRKPEGALRFRAAEQLCSR